MDPLLEAGRHLLEGIEVVLALVTAATLVLIVWALMTWPWMRMRQSR